MEFKTMTVQKGLLFLFLLIAVNFSLVVLTGANGNRSKQSPRLPKAVKDFNAAFKRKVESSKNLTSLFHISDKTTPAEIYAGKIYLGIALFRDVGSKNPAIDALVLHSKFPTNGKKLAYDVLLALYSNSVAKSMYKLKALNCKNSQKLANSYASVLESSYKKVANKKYLRSEATVLTMGVLSFVTSQFNVTDLVKNTFVATYLEELEIQDKLGNIPDADKVLPPVRNPDVNPLLKPDPKACHVSKTVQQFHYFFQNAVKSSKTLSNLYKLDPSVMFSKGAEYMNEFHLQKYGVQDAAILADFMTKYINNEIANKPSVLVSFLARFMGKYLESDMILNSKNARNLALRYAKSMEETAKFIVKEQSPRSNVASMAFAGYDYLRELRAFDASRGKRLAFFYGNEWKCLASKS